MSGSATGIEKVVMKVVRLSGQGHSKNLKPVEEDYANPKPGELLVRIRAASLNFHDDLVVHGKIPCAENRIPISDGAGEVLAVGDGVDEFEIADHVVSAFWPYWLGGDMTPATKRDIPGESVDGYAREYVCMPAHACRTGGHIAVIGELTGFAGEVSIPALFSNQIRISGISIGSRADQEDMIRAITANRLKPLIDRRFPLQEIVAAYKHYESQEHFGKVCLEF
jgi:NADPH:quinone reductase-like Zn-dependent oxidoreductase